MSVSKAYDKPLSVEVLDGEVVIWAKDGPFGVSLTLAAAIATAERLSQAVKSASADQSQTGALLE